MTVPKTQFDAFAQWWEITKQRKTPETQKALDKLLAYKSLPNNFVLGNDVCWSYGRHFPLLHITRDKKGNITQVILNGDRWGGNSGFGTPTLNHQGWVRGAVQQAGFSHCIIPFSVLQAARLDYNSVVPVEVTRDRNEEITHTWTSTGPHDLPAGIKRITQRNYEMQRKSQEVIDNLVTSRQEAENAYWEKRRQYSEKAGQLTEFLTSYPVPTVTEESLADYQLNEYVEIASTVHYRPTRWGSEAEVETLPDGRRTFRWIENRHWLGECVIKARVSWNTRHTCKGCSLLLEPFGGSTWRAPEAVKTKTWNCKQCGGDIGFNRSHHRNTYFLSGFDHNEPRPLYFFCELPSSSHPTSVAEAYEDLKPEAVKLALEMGREVIRQGDIFAVPLSVTTKELRKQGAQLRHRNKQTSIMMPVDKARELWKGHNTEKTHQKMYAYGTQKIAEHAIAEIIYTDETKLLTTNHEATDVAYMPDGTTLAKGILWHSPERRAPDHIRRKLGDGKSWYLIVKNTVPLGKSN